jgi:hypothetical protein
LGIWNLILFSRSITEASGSCFCGFSFDDIVSLCFRTKVRRREQRDSGSRIELRLDSEQLACQGMRRALMSAHAYGRAYRPNQNQRAWFRLDGAGISQLLRQDCVLACHGMPRRLRASRAYGRACCRCLVCRYAYT